MSTRNLLLIGSICLSNQIFSQHYSDTLGNYVSFFPERKIEFCLTYTGGGLGPYKLCGCSSYRIKRNKVLIIYPEKLKTNCDFNKMTDSFVLFDTLSANHVEVMVYNDKGELIEDKNIFVYYYEKNEIINVVTETDGQLTAKLFRVPHDSILYIGGIGYQELPIRLTRNDSLKVRAFLKPHSGIFAFFSPYNSKSKMKIMMKENSLELILYSSVRNFFMLYRK